MIFDTTKFFTFEGGEGSGKTTLVKNVAKILEENGYEVLITREPGGFKNEVSEDIRNLIMKEYKDPMHAMTEFLLFSASRYDHILKTVKPAIDSGKIVLCDRFADSSAVYQGYVKELGIEKVLKITDEVISNKWPNKTFYLKLDPKVGLERIMSERSDETNRFDFASLDFHKKVSEGYDKISKIEKDRFITLDATKNQDELSKIVSNKILNIIK